MKHKFFPCPYTSAPKCGDHIGYCNECKRYGRLTVRDKIINAMIATCMLIMLLIVLVSCGPDEAQQEVIYGNGHGVVTRLLRFDSCQYIIASGNGIVHKANCSNPIHSNPTYMQSSSSSSLYLFQNSQTIDDIMGRLQQLAGEKSSGYNLSIGMSKDMQGNVRYSAMIILTDRHGKNAQHIVDGCIVASEVYRQLTEFLEGL